MTDLLLVGASGLVGQAVLRQALADSRVAKRFSSLSRVFSVTSEVVRVCFGFFLVYQLGFLGGLFTSHSPWTPH